jgi:hypothetical protein
MKHFRTLLFLLLSLFSFHSFSQMMSQQARDSIAKLSREDHQLMMTKLGITALRPGPSGNPEASNAANSDESKATAYTFLPDPLVFNDGSKVTTPKQWEARKLEIKEDFDREMYGRIPENVPGVTWKVKSEKDSTLGKTPVKIREMLGIVDNSSYPEISVTLQMSITIPVNSKGKVPLVLEFGWNFPPSFRLPPQEGKPWQEQILENGWGYAVLVPTSYQADHGAGLRSGIIGLINKGQPRKLDDWGALRAWAWGASRAMDYFETDKKIDEKRVVIEGLSRYGKAAIVAMAYDERFAIGFIGSSGAGGAKILRRVFGEQVENLASSAEYHWFAPNFIKYAGPLGPNDLPVDAHQLIALCAPRPVFISVGSPEVEGQWIDARGMFLAGVHAGPVYRLLGKKDLGTDIFPPQETGLFDGEIAFRQHSGGHTVVPNWPTFIQYAHRYFPE